MKVSLRWLAEYIDLPTKDPAEIARVLESLGHAIESVTELTADWSGVQVAEVLTVAPHPDADKIRVCTVTTGGDPIQVICGAWNFDAGAKVAFAAPGAVLAGGFDIGVRTIRGVESHGMICSEKELGLGEEHGGILVLESGASVGEDFAEFVEFPDFVLDLEITPNRPDMMSMVGVARELGAFYGIPHRRPSVELETVPGQPSVGVTISAETGANRFTVREIRGVAIGASPFWLRRRLKAAGVRPISNIVDVTNYVMLELGHPLHSFDAERVRGDVLDVRWATQDEKLVTLDGVERQLTSSDLVIVDGEGPTSLAGTMGGLDSEVVESTNRVYMEAASWDPPTILFMSRRHGLRSEASARFERGVDPNLSLEANSRAVALLQQIGGGEILDGHIDVVKHQHAPWSISLQMSEIMRTLGPGFEAVDVAKMLESIDLGVEGWDPIKVTVPTFRPDLTRPIDLVEEVARLRGFDNFGASVPRGTGSGWSASQRIVMRLRDALVGAGLHEALSLSFLNPGDLDAFSYPSDHEGRAVVRVKNPLREEESILRTGLLPGLVRALRYNRSHGTQDVALFEIGKVFFDRPSAADPRIPDQPDRMAFAVAGSFGPTELGAGARPVDFYTAAGIWQSVVESMSIDCEIVKADDQAGYHPGRCAIVVGRNGLRLGVIGELHPAIAERFDLEARVAVGEFDVDRLVDGVGERPFVSPSVFPRVEFDLAFLLPPDVEAVTLWSATVEAAGDLFEHGWIFDVYQGRQDDRRSIAFRYILRAADRTLTGAELAEIRKSMVDAAVALGAELRGKL